MTGSINFIEITTEETCYYCGRRKINENDRFYRVLFGDNASAVVVCELCKGGFSGRILESPEKSYATHLIFYVRRSFLELKGKLSKDNLEELLCCLDNYESGNYSACFRGIGLVAEQLTNNLYVEEFGKLAMDETISWEVKLGKLQDAARKKKNRISEAVIYQLFSLKWFRNNADHPSRYQITAEDARIGLASIAYLMQWKLTKMSP
ncbi:MAG: hypothetical protein ABSF65_00035 [Candidatus Bathyarchaeia archaeon]|jgi:hypothetical protein